MCLLSRYLFLLEFRERIIALAITHKQMLTFEARFQTSGTNLIEMNVEVQQTPPQHQYPQLALAGIHAISDDGSDVNTPSAKNDAREQRETPLKPLKHLPSAASFELRWTNLNYVISQRAWRYSLADIKRGRLPKCPTEQFVILQQISGSLRAGHFSAILGE